VVVVVWNKVLEEMLLTEDGECYMEVCEEHGDKMQEKVRCQVGDFRA
jgi:hypothetical protein